MVNPSMFHTKATQLFKMATKRLNFVNQGISACKCRDTNHSG